MIKFKKILNYTNSKFHNMKKNNYNKSHRQPNKSQQQMIIKNLMKVIYLFFIYKSGLKRRHFKSNKMNAKANTCKSSKKIVQKPLTDN